MGSKNERGSRDGRRLYRYFTSEWQLFLLGMLCTAGVSSIEVLFVWLISDVVSATVEKNPLMLNRIALIIVGIHLVKWVFSYGQTYFISSATERIAVHLRNHLYAHLQRLPIGFFEKNRVGQLMSRITNDVNLVQNSSVKIMSAVSAPLVILGCLYTIFRWNPRLATVSVILLPLMSYTVTRIGRGMRGMTETLQTRLGDALSSVQETLCGVSVVKSFGMEDYESKRFAQKMHHAYNAAMRTVRRSAAMSPTIEIIGILGIAFVLWYGGNMVAGGTVPGFGTGALVGFLFALERIANSVRQLAGVNIVCHQASAGAGRIFELMDQEPEIKDAPGASPMPPIRGKIEFRNVYFSYGQKEPALSGISFAGEPGERIAILGPSGAGKSTIAGLIPRLREISDGEILIDGIDIRQATLASLRSHIATVPQETVLFSTSIKENIAYGKPDATTLEITEAAKAANADAFIRKLPQEYDTLVGERGSKLSGGERQRIAIARALLKDPRLLILDEATSSLDVASEALVQEALERLMKGRTTLVIAHRLSTVKDADLILVINQGRIAESGKHQELIDKNGLYARLWKIEHKDGAE